MWCEVYVGINDELQLLVIFKRRRDKDSLSVPL